MRAHFYSATALLLVLIASLSIGATRSVQTLTVTPEIQAALDEISADSLRGHLSFIASDLLEGRNTPSPGLETAAHYIAAQFRRAGLETVVDDSYLQTANWILEQRSLDGLKVVFKLRNLLITVPKEHISVTSDIALHLTNTPVFKVDYGEKPELARLTTKQMKGKVVLTVIPSIRRGDRSRRLELLRAQNDFLARMKSLGAAAVLSIERTGIIGGRSAAGRLIDPETRPPTSSATLVPLISVHDPKLTAIYDSMKPGRSTTTVGLSLPAQTETPVKLHNVIGVLRGSDPMLRDTFVIVTAHYDHVGVRETGGSDRIFNGANDDGSGTVSVIELAWALSRLKERPKRSIVFMTFFGEEKGLLGSRYYVRHPVFPLQKTVANINLELLGRTDSSDGQQISTASLTGFDYSDIGMTFKRAGDLTGIKVYKHAQNSDGYFARSDNVAFAEHGIPAHTVSVAYSYPDYHGVGDHWEKVDYGNMARVARMTAVALLMIANNSEEPRWNEENQRAARYFRAWKNR